MSEMTTAEAAGRLHVSQRQIQHLIRSGEVLARRTAGDAWVLDALAVNSLARSRPLRGRPWSTEVAWGALWMLSGLEATWVDGRTRSRLSSRLEGMDAADVVDACRRRAEVARCRVSESFLDDLSGTLVQSGTASPSSSGWLVIRRAPRGTATPTLGLVSARRSTLRTTRVATRRSG